MHRSGLFLFCATLLPLLSSIGCSTYEPLVELWPNSDASVGSQSVSVEEAGAVTGSVAASAQESGTVINGPDTGADEGGSAPDADTLATGPGDAGAPDVAVVGGTCSLSVTVTTVTDKGNYSPRNVGAIWIARSSGAFVKTLELWAQSETGRLTLWNSATVAANLRRNTVDAVTSATLSMHRTHNVTWNCTDVTANVVPDGAYRAYFEMTDRNASGPNMFVDFTKGPKAVSVSPPDQAYFKGINLMFTP